MLHIILYIIAGIAVLSVIAYFIQDKFIFKPEKLKQDFIYKYDAPFKELFFDVEEGVRINGLHFYVAKPLGLVLYFHGNSRSIKGWAKLSTSVSNVTMIFAKVSLEPPENPDLEA